MKFLFLFLNIIFATFKTLQNDDLYLKDTLALSKNDLKYNQPFFIFLYFERKDYNCPLCLEFKNYLAENAEKINLEIRQINFIDDISLASRFLLHTFPAFIIRYKNKSYILNPDSPEKLLDILISNQWMSIEPVRERIDVNSYFAIICGKINQFIFYFLDFYYYIVNYIPNYVISLIIILVIVYLMYSIFDVINTPDVKVKTE